MRFTDLSYLKEISDGDHAAIKEVVELFITQIPGIIKNLYTFLDNKQYNELGKEAHKAKSSLQIVGMTNLEKEMKILQLKTIEGKNPESYLLHVKNFETQCLAALLELEKELERMNEE